MNDWFDEMEKTMLCRGEFAASIKVNCSPHTSLNLRPVVTIKGKIEEWHLLIADPPQIDYAAISNGPKPTPGQPILTPSVIRFHPDDVTTSIDLQDDLREMWEKYVELGNKEPTTSNQHRFQLIPDSEHVGRQIIECLLDVGNCP